MCQLSPSCQAVTAVRRWLGTRGIPAGVREPPEHRGAKGLGMDKYATRTTDENPIAGWGAVLVVALVAAVIWAPIQPAEAAWPGEDGRLVFIIPAADNTALGDVHTALPDGSDLRRLTTSQSATIPAWSPDGTRILFREGGWIKVMDADGANVQTVMSGTIRGDVGWSPDGTRIIYATLDEIRTMPVAGGSPSMIIDCHLCGSPTYSPDGSLVAYIGEGGNLMTMRHDGTNQRTLAEDGSYYRPDFSPDASAIVVDRHKLAAADIWAISVDDGSATPLTSEYQYEWGAVYSPSGTYVAWTKYREHTGTPNDLWVMNANGSGKQLVVERGEHPDWQPVPSSSRFQDVPETHLFFDDIEWMGDEGITRGCNPPENSRFCPDKQVTRGQMAAFLVRALGLIDRLDDPFVDDDDSVFEADIERLAAAGITRGCNPPSNTRFCPDAKVTRGQMAAFLVRALGYTDDGGGDLFIDDNDSIFEHDIDCLGTAGVTRGCNPADGNTRFCPRSYVTRAQMAAFLHRALGDGPSIVTSKLPTGNVDLAYTKALTASGGTLPLTWSIVSGKLPSGLSLSTSGAISGIPTSSADTALDVRVSDSDGRADTTTFDLLIRGTTTRVSVSSDGAQGNTDSFETAISGDGRYVAFVSTATTLVDTPTGGVASVFRHDRMTGETTLVSAGDAGAGSGESFDVAMSSDGRYIAFASYANNLTPGDDNFSSDVFVWDATTKQLELVSADLGGTPAGDDSSGPTLSADGRYIAFASRAADLVSDDGNGVEDVFVRDMISNATEAASLADDEAASTGDSWEPTISGDGSLVAFTSAATNLVPGDANGRPDVYLRDLDTAETTRLSLRYDGTESTYPVDEPAMSSDGRYVAMVTAGDLTGGFGGGCIGVYVVEVSSATVERIDPSRDCTGGPDISGDGRYVIYYHSGDHSFVFDRLTGTSTMVSVSTSGASAEADSEWRRWPIRQAISDDGGTAVFGTNAPNLVPDDTNGMEDIFMHRW